MMVTLAWPPPSHMVSSPRRPPVRSSEWTSVVSRRAPVAPRGWPRAIAPPQTLTRAGSAPVSRCQARTTEANASLISIRSISSRDRPGLVQGVRGGRDRGGEHQDRVVAARGQVGDPGLGRQAVLVQCAFGRDEQRGGAVGDLAGQRGGDPAAVAQRLERGHLVQRGVAARALVLADAAVGRDLGAEGAAVDRAHRPLVAGQGVAFHLRPADPPLVGDQVRGAELGDLLGAVPGVPALGVGEGSFGAHRRADRDHAHVLHAARDDQVGGPAEHGLRGEVHRLLRGAALAVHGDAGHRLGQARREPRGAGDVAGLRPDRVHAAEHHVVDGQRVGVGAGQQVCDHVRAEIGRVRGGQAAAAAADRGAHRVDNEGLGHPCLAVVGFVLEHVLV